MKKKQINVSISLEDYEKYMRLYRGTLTKFISNCVFNAINNKDFFYQVFFNEVKK